jgi:hypothetical protein
MFLKLKREHTCSPCELTLKFRVDIVILVLYMLNTRTKEANQQARPTTGTGSRDTTWCPTTPGTWRNSGGFKQQTGKRTGKPARHQPGRAVGVPRRPRGATPASTFAISNYQTNFHKLINYQLELRQNSPNSHVRCPA